MYAGMLATEIVSVTQQGSASIIDRIFESELPVVYILGLFQLVWSHSLPGSQSCVLYWLPSGIAISVI